MPEALPIPFAVPRPSTAPILITRNLSFVFQDNKEDLKTLEQITFSVRPQEFVCVLGPSGSGKTTLLRVLAGLLPPTAGEVRIEGELLTGPLRRSGFVFQKANLMPWRTVRENITLPLEMHNVPQDEAETRALALINLVGLQGFVNALPADLSGGMAQRVAIARALIHNPDILLLDEPFGALDALTRERMGMELLRIWQTHRKTVIMVTHSISEALFLADRVLVLTQRPARLKLDLPVNLPRPRGEETHYSPQFAQLSRQLRAAIEDMNK